jgi:hypothetical protein
MNPPDDDAIEAMLRRQFAGPVPDDGFTARVMQRVPTRRRRRAWPVWAGLFGGAAVSAWSLRSSSLIQAGWHDVIGNEPSVAAIALCLAAAGLSLLAAVWVLMEAEDR